MTSRNFDVINVALLSNFNHVTCIGVILLAKKKTLVIQLFKRGARIKVENYRFISVSRCFAKILEKHLGLTMTYFLDKPGILSHCQYEFTKGRGAQMLLEVFYDI